MGKQNLEETILFHLPNANFTTIETTGTNASSGSLAFVFVVPENDDFTHLSHANLPKDKKCMVSIND